MNAYHYSADKIISHRPTPIRSFPDPVCTRAERTKAGFPTGQAQTDTPAKCASDFTGQADIFLSVVRTSSQISETFLKLDSLKVGFGKIIALEKEWFAGIFCQSIRTAIANVESCGVAALAKGSLCKSRQFTLLRGHSNDFYLGTV